MKLGDNITMEAYNVWEGVAPRKCRPPRIGDIPKHGAVDEESPGSSTKQLTISPTDPGDPTLNISLDHTRNIVFPLEPGQPPEKFVCAQKFESRNGSPLYPEKKEFAKPRNLEANSSSDRDSRDLVDSASLCKRRQTYTTRSTSPIYSRDSRVKESLDPDSRITIKLSPTEESSRRAEFEGIGQESPKIPSSPENTSDQEIVEVRKDSALFLEEAEGFPSLREILKARAPRFVRPRRESSGYASNLGTFDEDRRNSASIDALQDLSSFLKERRRSSTKRLNSRIGLGRAEDSLTEESANTGVDRMPTTEVYRKVSSAGLEMPNIEEVKEVLREEASSRQDSLDNLCSLVERVSAEETSTRCRLQKDATNPCASPKGVCASAVSTSEAKSCVPAKSPDFSRDVFDTTPLKESIEHVTSQISSLQYSRNSDKIVHRHSPDTERPDRIERSKLSTEETRPRYTETGEEKDRRVEGAYPKTENVRQSSRVYQLLSTQSEDTADGEPRLTDRRTSLEISKRKEDALLPKTEQEGPTCVETRSLAGTSCDSSPIRKLSSPGEGTTHRYLGDGDAVTVRPIYPYCPYSPYGSPQGSPRNRRRPLRESRRVSIDNRQGALQLNQYKLLDNIGQGSYGIVKLVYNEEDETHYAMKILSKKKLMKKAGIFGRMAPGRRGSANPLAKVYREIALLKKLDHPNVVKLAEVLDDPDEDNLYLVFELVQRGEVLEIPTDKPLDEESARKNFRDIVMGVEYLHYQRIVHRDIKPSNLLVDSDGRIKIADLGVSAELRASEELLSGPAGTPAFAAPETTTLGAHYSGTLCDVWSMGVTLYSLVTGRVPWDGAGSIIGVQTAIRTEPVRFPSEPGLSDDLRDLITRMLAKDPAERITLPEIKEHRWLTRNGKEPLPSEADNCRLPVTVTDEEVERVVTRVPKLDTLILIKTMLKQHSFQNPFLPKKSGRTAGTETVAGNLEVSSSPGTTESLPRREIVRNLKTERLQKSRRSNSAPDSYDWQANGRQVSMESPLPPVTEASSQESESIERR